MPPLDRFRFSLAALVCAVVIVCAPLSAPAATLTWGTSGNGGSGTWDLSNSGWWNGSQVQWVNNTPPDDAVFAGTAGTVTLGANITTGTITVNTTGYTINSGANALTVSRIDISSLGASGQLNLGAKLTGNSALSLAGAGDTSDTGNSNANLGIVLSNTANDFVGDVTITNRLVSYAADSVFGNAANKIIMDGGGLLDNNVSVNLARDIEVRSGGGIIRFWNTSNATWSGALSGTGNIRRTDTGTLTLSGNLSTYSGTFSQVGYAAAATIITGSGTVGGNWTVSSGTVTFNSASNQTAGGALSGSFVKSGSGTLTLTNATVGGNWTVNTGGGLAIQSDSAQSLAGAISGAGNVTKAGAGVLTLTGANTYTGTTTITGGTLQVGNGSTAGSIANTSPVSVSAGAAIAFNRSDAVTYSGTISGAGGFVKLGAGALTLSSGNTYTGNMTISSGTVIANLTVDSSSPTATSLGNMTTVSRTITTSTGATLRFDQRDAIGSYSYVTPVTLIADGGTITRVANANQFSSIGNVELRNGGRLTTTNGNTTTVQSFGLNGSVTVSGTSGSFIDTLSGQTSNSGINLGNNTGSYSGTTTFNVGFTNDPTADLTVSASLQDKTLSGASSLLKTGSGRMVLSGANTFSGTLTVASGSVSIPTINNASANGPLGNSANAVVLGSSGTTGALAYTGATASSTKTFTLATGGTGAFDVSTASTALTLSGAIGGSGGFVKQGAGTLALGGANTYTGATTVTTGTLQVGNGSTSGTIATGSPVSVSSGATIAFNRSDAVTYSGTIGGAGAFVKLGAGALTLSSGNTFTGNMTISSGTVIANLTVNNSSPTATSLGNMTTSNRTITTSTGATLRFDLPDAIGQYNYTSPVTLIADGGTITRIASANTFNSIGSLTLQNGGRLTTTNGNALTVGSFAINGTVTVQGTSGSFIDTLSGQTSNSYINLGTTAGSTTFNVGSTGDPTADLTVSAVLGDKVLSGAAGLTKTGSGRMVLSAANTFTGVLTVSSGSVSIPTINDSGTAGPLGNSANAVVLGSSGSTGALAYTGATASSTKTFTLATSGTGAFDVSTAATALTLSGAIGGSGGLVKQGPGTLTLSGNNTFSGLLTVSQGTLSVATVNAPSTNGPLGNSTNAVVLGSSGTVGVLAYTGATASIAKRFTLATGGTGAFDVPTAVALTLSGSIDGSGGLVKQGAGTLTLSGTNTFAGQVTVSQGTLSVATVNDASANGPLGNSVNAVVLGSSGTVGVLAYSGATASSSKAFSLAAGGTGAFDVPTATTLTLGGGIAGSGGLVKQGAGTLALSGSNTFSGGSTLSAGVLSLGSADALGTSGVISFVGGTLQFSAANTNDYSSRFSTAASQAFSIDTNGQAISLGTALTSNGATLAKLGSGTLTLAANNTYSGATTVSAGVLRLGNGGAAGSVAGGISVASGASLAVNRSDAFTLSSAVSGSGGFVQAGTGTTTLGVANTYSGATTITGGVLAVSADDRLGTAPGSATPGSIVINGATLAFTSGFTLSSNRGIALGPATGSGTGTIDVASGQTLTYGGVIANNNGAGTDGLIKAGAGILALTGSASYTGNTSVNNGTLQIGAGSSLASPLVTVASGATLSGRGTLNAVTMSSGGILAPGIASSGTLTTGALTFSGAATVTMGVASKLPSNLLNVLGNVTPNGGAGSVVFAFGSNLATIGSGTYSIVTYSGTLTDTSAFGYTGTQGSRQSVVVDGTTTTGTVSLVIGNSFPVWTGTNTNDWYATNNWLLSPGNAPTDFQVNDTVEFSDAATQASGTVVISGSTAQVASVTFSADTKDYTLSGGFGISGTAAGLGSLIKSGSALLTITNANTYGAGTTLSAGRIRVGNDSALGTGDVTVSGSAALSSDSGTARTLANGLHIDADLTLGDATDNGNLTISGTVTFDGQSRTITTPSNVTLSGLITNGNLTKAGAGILTITGSNSYGTTTLSAGTLRVGNDSALGTAGVVTLANGVTLSSDSGTAHTLTNQFTISGNVTLGDATNTGALSLGSVGGVNLGAATRQVTTASDVTFAGIVSNGGLTKLGAGTLTLAAANSYANGTTLSAGALALGNVGGLGSGTLTVAGNGTVRTALTGTVANAVAVNPAVTATFEATTGVATYAGVISGSGAVAKSGGGTVVFSATSTYTGDTTVSAGTLEIGGAGLLGGGSYAGAITNSGTLSITSSAAQTLSGAISGTGRIAVNSAANQTISGAVSGLGSLTKAGAGTLTLSNASNSYSGGSTITGGTVAFSNGALGSSGNVTVNNASLRWATGNTQDISSQLALVNAATATFDVGSNNVTLASGFGAGTSGAVTKTGAGTLTLSGSNGYTGLTTVSTGTLQIGAGGSTGSVAGDIATAATLAFNRSDASTYSGVISGAGAVRQVGTGTTTLTGSNTFSGQLTVAQGAVAVTTVNNASADGPLGNSTNSVVLGSSGATGLLAYTGATASSTKRFTLATGGTGAISVPTATTLTLSGSIDGSGGFVKQGPGTLSLSGANPFTGNMTIASGTVNVNLTVNTTSPTATALGNMTTSNRTITVNSGATLNFVLADAIGRYDYKTPVTLIADGGTIFRSSSGGNYFNSLGDVELRNGGRLTTNNGNGTTVQSYGLNGNLTVSGTSGSFIDTVGSSFNGINLGNNVSYGGSTTFTVNSTGDPTADLTVSVPLADRTLGGASAVVKAGAGKMLMTGKSIYTGNTTINAGTLAIGSGGQIYNGGYRAAVVTVASGATLDLQNWGYNETSNASLGGLSADATSMVVDGGTVRISGASSTSYGRGVTVNSGGATLEAAAGANWTIDVVNDNTAWVYNSNPAITLTGGGTGQFDKVLGNGSGGLTKSGSGTWTLTGVNTFTGNTTISAGTLVLGGAGQLGGGTYGGNISNAGALQVTTSANQTLSGVVSGVGSIAKSGAGTLTLSNASNTFSGGSTISGGILSFANDALGPSGAVTMNGGTLRWETGNSQDVSSRLTLVADADATLDTNGNNVTLGTGLGGGISANLVKTGAGTLTLSGSNGYSGNTLVSVGTLAIAGSGNIASSSGLDIASGAVFDIANASGPVNIGTLIGSGSVALGGNTLRSTIVGESLQFDGVMDGSGGFTKAGGGSLTLTNPQTFTGSARVEGGMLAIGGSNTLATASQIYVASGATLDTTAAGLIVGGVQTLAGSGTVAGGFTIADGATLSPGNSPGTLYATGTTIWGGAGNYNWQIYTVAGGTGTGFDFIDSTGSLNITASGANKFNINMWSLSGLPNTTGNVSDFDPSFGYNFLIAEFDGGITGWDPSAFSLNTGAVNGTGGFMNDIAGQGDFALVRGNQVTGGKENQIWIVYAAVPEPGTLALAGLGLVGLGLAFRRRRRKAGPHSAG